MTDTPPHPFPFPDPPASGHALAVAPGILWLRFALPFRLNHVNLYAIEDHDGWLLVDTGAADAPSLAAWTALLQAGPEGPLRGRPITRILVTHHHPDHVGAAAFLADRTGAPLLMGETEYLMALLLISGDADHNATARAAFYRSHGLNDDRVRSVAGHVERYRALVPALPATFAPLRPGDRLAVGPRTFDVMTLPGHAPAQIVLHSAVDNVLLAADHVLTRITPNIGVLDRAPDDDPLGQYLASLTGLRARVPDGGLVLPGHHLPFRHLHDRCREIEHHHAARCEAIVAACSAGKGLTVAELVPILFPFPLDSHQFWFAFGEALAHLNFLGRQGRLEPRDSHGRRRWGAVGRRSHLG